MPFHNKSKIFRWLLLLVFAFFIWLMVGITAAYIPYNTDVGFLMIKQHYMGITHWKFAFFIHVYSSILVLFVGFTQFSGSMLRKRPGLHRAMGWAYAANVLFLAGPSGLLLGFYANGGITSKVSFVLLGLLWIGFTALALQSTRVADFTKHRRFMIRSFALALSALTLRAWKWGITNSMELPPMDVYRIVAWLGWVPNLILAEWMIWKTNKNPRTVKD